MLEFPKDISQARILISNDDSIHAEGIRVLEEIVTTLTPNVWVVAPETQQSAAGHSLTIHMPLRMKEYDKRHYSVYGTPTDSVLVGVQKVMHDFRPHLVLSGINHGQNTADDVTYSGTIAAACEATLMAIPAIAFSQDFDETGGKPDWSVAREYLPKILKAFQGHKWEHNILMSVNFPTPKAGFTPEIRPVPQGHYSVEKQDMVNCIDPRGRPYFWIGPPPERDEEDQTLDMGALAAGHVTITPLSLNLTNYPMLSELGKVFEMSLLARKIRLIMKLRKCGITDTSVLAALERVPREVFIPPTFHDQAYEDTALPIDRGQTISQPLVVAYMTQELRVNDRHKVLEIGTGSGYQAAILAKLCRRVYSIERHKPLLVAAERRFTDLRIRNLTAKAADGMKGWIEQAPFDRIIVTAAAAEAPPQPLLDQLAINGILIIPMGRDKSSQYIYRITRTAEGYTQEQLMPVRFVPLLPDVARNEPDPLEREAPEEGGGGSEFFFRSGPVLQPA